MISLIVGLIILSIAFIIVIVACIKEFPDLFYLAFLVGGAALLCFICCIVGNNMHINKENYLKLNFMSEHLGEMSVYEQAATISDINYWNENLNNGNNYWFKFKLEDRSMYYIELQNKI